MKKNYSCFYQLLQKIWCIDFEAKMRNYFLYSGKSGPMSKEWLFCKIYWRTVAMSRSSSQRHTSRRHFRPDNWTSPEFSPDICLSIYSHFWIHAVSADAHRCTNNNSIKKYIIIIIDCFEFRVTMNISLIKFTNI